MMHNKDTIARRKAYQEWSAEDILDSSSNAQNVFTPYDLCYDIIRKLDSKTRNLSDKEFLVFNLEFAEVLIHDFGVSPERIAFWTDCEDKIVFAKNMYEGIKWVKVELTKESIEIMSKGIKDIKDKDKFDVVIGNPPYQASSNIKRKGGLGSRNTIWQKFVELSLELCKKKGYVCLVHPPRWRKPGNELWDILKVKNMHYVEMHDAKDGKSMFGVGTRYDWYILQNSDSNIKTTIKDINNNIYVIDLRPLPFLPSAHINKVLSLLSSSIEDKFTVLYSSSKYETRKDWMRKHKDEKYKYPCIHRTGKKGCCCWYSSKKGVFFGQSKV
ncbi:MAG TPA: Eco57I restriction-modification methylase domain-containing protein, partial [Candidatus Glassbacteria bacterium]|nr:Eco57I restriction-modification methylase domain-containing protein [Candidatus Glassbacteria bacterium]